MLLVTKFLCTPALVIAVLRKNDMKHDVLTLVLNATADEGKHKTLSLLPCLLCVFPLPRNFVLVSLGASVIREQRTRPR